MRRTTFKILGAVSVAVGIVGAFLPILPSTIFFILAAACFARSSPALEAKLLAHPVAGPQIISWRQYGAIPKMAKVYALTGMTFGYVFFYLSTEPETWLAILVGIFMIGSAAYVLSRPSGPPAEERE